MRPPVAVSRSAARIAGAMLIGVGAAGYLLIMGVEAMEPDGSPVGTEGLERRLRELRDRSPRDIAETLLEHITAGPSPGAEPDDRSLIVVAADPS